MCRTISIHEKTKEELARVERLLLRGELKEALQSVEILESSEMTLEEQLTCTLLKSKLMVKQGKFKEAIEIAEQALRKIQLTGEKLREVDAFLVISEALWRAGKVDEGLAYSIRIEKALSSITGKRSEEITERKGELMHHKGIIYRRKGEVDRPLKFLEQSLEYRRMLGNKHGIGESLNSIGVIYFYKGDLNRALEYYRESLETKEELGNKQQIAITLNNIGDVYKTKGELDRALEYFLQCNALLEETTGNKEHISASLHNIGNVYHNKGNFDRALEYLEKALELGMELGNKIFIAETLYFLVQVAIDKKDQILGQRYLQQLLETSEQMDNKLVNQYYQVARALLLKANKRLRDKIEAAELLDDVIRGAIIDHGVTVTAMLHSCELFLIELQITGEEELFADIKKMGTRLLEIAKQQASHSLLAETYLLLSRLSLMELNIQRATRMLTQARLIAEERGLEKLTVTIAHEEDLLSTQLERWKLIIDQKPDLKEITRLTQINELIGRMIHKRVYMDEKEILEYVTMAKQLLKAWEKTKNHNIT
ncbi:MAG: tetratricopeptide repeat protein [Candidatus Odinarchaeota archaeon]